MPEIEWKPDKVNSISSATGRLIHEGARAVEVAPGASSKVQIAALMDLLDLHLTRVAVGKPVDPGRVVLRVPSMTSEAGGALGTLRDCLLEDLHIDVLEEAESPSTWSPATIGWNPSHVEEYAAWPELLARPRLVPDLVIKIVDAVEDPALRAYPMLSTSTGWSLRLEGLEVARVARQRVRLTVGKDGKTGGHSLQRATWVAATGHADPVDTDDPAAASRMISLFATAWHGLATAHNAQDEHALESRILRGATPVPVGDTTLSLIQPDPVVNWGSQFPTKWGPGGKSRYLDALLRDGETPWAIEMKVEGGGGVGQYYRHAVAQAVLYREFIRRAAPLHGWFERRQLNAPACEAAVVVPRLANPKQAHWAERVGRLCEAFGVRYIEVDAEHARRH